MSGIDMTGASLRRWPSRRRAISNSSGAATARSYPQDAGLLRVLDHRQGEGGPRGGRPGIRQDRSRRRSRAARRCWRRCGCTTCGGCCSTSGPACTFSTRASSTPTSTSTPRTRSQLFSATGITTVFTNLEGFPGGLEGEPGGIHQVRPRAPVPQLPGVRRVPVRHRRRDQEGAAAEGGLLGHARPDAVTARCSSSTTFSTSC